jgi:hypothetical protein
MLFRPFHAKSSIELIRESIAPRAASRIHVQQLVVGVASSEFHGAAGLAHGEGRALR